jgi:hypothetical protein
VWGGQGFHSSAFISTLVEEFERTWATQYNCGLSFATQYNCGLSFPETFSPVLSEGIFKSRGPDGPIFYHSQFQLFVTWAREFPSPITPTPGWLQELSLLSSERLLIPLLTSSRKLCCIACHYVFVFQALGKYLLWLMTVQDCFITSPIYNMKECF